MATQGGLREFQEDLSRRIAMASAQERVRTKLAAESGGEVWILDLPDAGEVMPLPQFASVPLTRPWFLGMANVRGNLFGAVDFAGLCGKGVTPRNAEARLLLVGQRFGINAALVFRRIVGLRNEQDLAVVGRDSESPPWKGRDYQDSEGRLYRELDVRTLLQTPEFLNVAA